MRVIVREGAYRDLETIFDYIATDSVLAARRTTLEILYATVRLAVFPRLGRSGSVEGTREFVIDHRFIMVYRIHESPSVIEVIAVAHVKRDRPNI